MVGAGLLACNAAERGLSVPAYVKTSLAPGSRVVSRYLDAAGLTESLEALGFHTVGYGCTTCIGNSGPLPEEISAAVADNDLVVCSVLSGNRNFEGRVHAVTRANFLASAAVSRGLRARGAGRRLTLSASRWAATKRAARCSCAISGPRRTRSATRLPAR